MRRPFFLFGLAAGVGVSHHVLYDQLLDSGQSQKYDESAGNEAADDRRDGEDQVIVAVLDALLNGRVRVSDKRQGPPLRPLPEAGCRAGAGCG